MISIIVAFDDKMGIGKAGKLPWHIPEDLAFFKKTTLGHRCLMGRKTYESILDALSRPLPKRQSIVASKKTLADPRVDHVRDLQGFLKKHEETEEEVFVIGGHDIYRQAIPYARRLYVTRVKGDHDADTFFPDMDFSEYDIVSSDYRETHNITVYERVR